MEGIFALAESARVPILIHAGRGLPPLGDELVELTLRHPDVVLILAHGAICDQGIITSRLADHPGVLYDISCFFPLDVIELLARAPIERIVFASDPPYGLPATSLYMALRVAAHAGLDEAAVRGMLGGTIAGLIDGHGLPPVTRPAARPHDHALRSACACLRLRQPRRVPRCSWDRPSRPTRCSTWRSRPAATPIRATSERRCEVIEAALSAADAMLCLQTAEGTGAAIDLVYRAIVRAATELPDSH